MIFSAEPTHQVIGCRTLVLIVPQPLAAVAALYMKAINDIVNTDSHVKFMLHILYDRAYVRADSQDNSIEYLTMWWWSDEHYR